MALINKIRNWLNRHIAALNCKLNGHTDVILIERYETITRAKNYRGSRLDNLKQAPHLMKFL